MKFLFVLSLFVVMVALSQVLAQAKAGEDSKQEAKQSVQFGKIEAGKPRVYDPCNSNPFDHAGCTSACWSVGYYNGGFCSGYDCYCYI